MARRAAGVRERKDGTLEKRFTIRGKRYSVYGRTNKEITEKEQEIRDKIKQGIYTDNRNITLDKYFDEWIERHKGEVKEITIYRETNWYKNKISPVLGSRKIQELERREIYLFQQELAKTYHPNTVNWIMGLLGVILNTAVTDEIIIKSPAAGINKLKDPNKTKAVDSNHRALTEEEQQIFMEAAKDSFYYEFYALLLLTGIRFGEAAALTWTDIDYKNNVIHVNKTYTLDHDGKLKVGSSTKTQAGTRDIPMNESIREILQMQKKKVILLFGGNMIPFNTRLFVSNTGGMLYNNTVNRALKKILQKLEEDQEIHIDDFSVHAFRDTFATRFIEQGGNPQTLKTILGHSSLEMTMDLYSHVLPNTKQKEMDMLRITV